MLMTVTIRDVARRAGVSVGTVSNVLNERGSVNAATAELVRGAIAELGYIRNDAARQLRAGRSRGIGLVVLDVANPFFAAVARGAEARAAEDGKVVLLGSSEHDVRREEAYLELFLEQRAAGVLLSPAAGDDAGAERLVAAGIPVVLVDRPSRTGIASVTVDDEQGGYLAVSHLLARGRRRIVFVGDPTTTLQVRDRLSGARRAVAADPGATLDVLPAAEMTVLAGRAAGERLRDRPDRPDAVFAANDLLAVGVLQALTMLSDIRVPDDVAIVGYDDIDFAAAAVVSLTTVRQPAEALGRTAADLVLRQAAGPLAPEDATVRFHPELIVRASTGG